MMRVLLRADAGAALGTGHVMRCLALADELKRRGSECVFVMRSLEGNLLEEVSARGFAVRALEAADDDQTAGVPAWLARQAAGPAQLLDARRSLQVAGGDGVWDWVVVDHYALDARWQQAMRPAARRILAIDDLADRPHAADVVLDQNPQPPGRYDALVPPGTVVLAGPGHALLREEFAQARSTRPPRRASARDLSVLVTFGGADMDGVALDAVTALTLGGVGPGQATVVAGGRNPHAEALEMACASAGFTFVASTGQMAQLMAHADLCIGAGGTSLLERFALGLPTLLVPIAANQWPGSRAAAQLGAAWLVDAAPDGRVAALAQAVRQLANDTDLRLRIARAAAALCDAKGASRLAARMQRMALSFQPATLADGEDLLAWRNAPETRRHSGDGQAIGQESHLRWLAAVLADPARRLWIARLGNTPLGVVRFDTSPGEQGRHATVSVYRVPGGGGRGWGSALIAAGVDEARRTWPELSRVDARISPDNHASLRAFAACGFVPGADAGLHHLDLRSKSN